MVSWTIPLAYIVEKIHMAIVSQDQKKGKKRRKKKQNLSATIKNKKTI
jgi:hypothetical protein